MGGLSALAASGAGKRPMALVNSSLTEHRSVASSPSPGAGGTGKMLAPWVRLARRPPGKVQPSPLKNTVLRQPSLAIVRLTPAGRGAVASLLVEGPRANQAVQAHFRAAAGRPLASYPPDRLVFGHFDFGAESREEVVVRAGSGQSVEIHCHGGHAAVAALEKALLEEGGRTVSWQQWAHERDEDAITGAARIALAQARTERAALVLLDQFHGALRQAIEAICRALSRGDTASAARQIETLLARVNVGRHLVEPWRVVLAGPPNVGKSSLINALMGFARAIVHPASGTTRDVVSVVTAVDGWPVELSDTAGLRAGGSELERAGMALAEEKLADADLVILVFDSSVPWSAAEAALVEDWADALVVHNKCDLPSATDPPRPEGLPTCALDGTGIDDLVRAMAGRLVPRAPPPGAAVPFTPEQIDRLESAADAAARDDAGAAQAILRAL